MSKSLRILFAVAIAASPSIPKAGSIPDEVSKVGGIATFGSAVTALTGAQVSAAQGTSTVSLKASRTHSYVDTNDDDIGKFDSWSLTATSPLNKSGDDSDITTLDGLTNATALELTFSRFLVPGKKSALAVNARREQNQAICDRLVKAIVAKDGGKSEDVAKNANCDTTTIEKYLSKSDLDVFRDSFWDDSKTMRWLYGGSGKVGYQDFEYVDSAQFSRKEQNETPWSLRAFLALNPESWNSIFILSFQYQDAYRESGSGVICPASAAPTGSISCLSGPVGTPQETKKKLLSFEARTAVLSWAGIGLTTTYDFDENVFGVELPIYIFQAKDGKFNGGIKGGWRDDTNTFSASVFIGSTFQLF